MRACISCPHCRPDLRPNGREIGHKTSRQTIANWSHEKQRGIRPLVTADDVADPAGRGCAMDSIATLLLCGLALYLATGVAVGVAFVTMGVTAVQPASVTAGARVLLLPGAIALWPLVLSRWLRVGSRT
jgi:hypothetical protein